MTWNPDSVAVTQLHRHLGAVPLSESTTRFCVWAPRCRRVAVELMGQDRVVEMEPLSTGHHVIEVEDVSPGERYLYRLESTETTVSRPDPASRFQPLGVHGPSEVVLGDTFSWQDDRWCGVQAENLVIYELHLGTFTDQGTYLAAAERLDELVDLGITAIELMPLADAPGRWNWGYDGVCLFAPNHNYGTPDHLRQLVSTAHAKGLAVILDVVYNHLGPEGNYLADFGPYLSRHHHTPWGAAPNFDDPVDGRQLRRFFIANATYWFDEFHFDGLRVDAIHCMRDDSPRHLAVDISQAVKRWSKSHQRPAMLIAESNVYDPGMLTPIADGGVGFDAEWCDDFMHSVFAVLRPGQSRCDRSYQAGADLDQTLTHGYVYEGSLSTQRGRRSPTGRPDTRRLVYSIQNHDFIGNHPLGERLHQITSLETQRAAAALLFLVPPIPMIFMGEEFACDQPFRFFVDFTDDPLRQAVVEGRRREYPQLDWSRGILATDPRAFQESKIGSAECGNRTMRQWYRELIALRKQWRGTGLMQDTQLSAHHDVDRGMFAFQYRAGSVTATVAARLVADPSAAAPSRFPVEGQLLLDSRPGETDRDQWLPNHAKVFMTAPGIDARGGA